MARKIEQLKRNRRIRRIKQTVLFEFEGNNMTEENYFKHFQNRNNDYNVKFAYGHDTDPVGMIKSLINYMKKEDINMENGDKIYCVFDGDLNINKQKRIDEAIKLAETENIDIIISTPSFELWYRLHYSYTTKTYSSNKDLIKDLKKYIPNYEKNMDVYNLLEKYTKVAIENSKKLEEYQLNNLKKLNAIECNPYTSVYKPVEYLLNRKNKQ